MGSSIEEINTCKGFKAGLNLSKGSMQLVFQP